MLGPTRRRAAAALLTLAVALTACGGSGGAGGGTPASATPTTAQAATPVRPLRWTACRGREGPSGYQCATLKVPLDPADPSVPGTIGLALDRRPAGGHVDGTIVEDPGGPGASGVDFLPSLVAAMPASLLRHWNIVGFDPPGVDRSDPVSCGAGPLTTWLYADPSPSTPGGVAALVADSRRFAASCQADSGPQFAYVSTADAAMDMDRIREALGEAKLTYLGFSWGSLLGQTYADLFPTRVRAMVLDGPIDPAAGVVGEADEQAAALDAEFAAFAAACNAGECGWQPAGSPVAAFLALVARVRAHPVAVPGTGQAVGPAVLLLAVAAGLYSPADWPSLGAALDALEQGSGRTLVEVFDEYVGRQANGTYSNVTDAEEAVDCTTPPVPTVAGLEAAAPAIEREAPIYGLFDLYGDLTCAVWTVPASGPAGELHAAGAPPIVVVGTTHDPVTPYVWAEAVARQLDRGVLVTRDGYGHTAYLFSACIRGVVDAYLTTAVPPSPGRVCS